MSAAHTPPGPWHISASDTGVHLMHNNYCVTRLDGRDPHKITDALNPHLVPHDDPAPQLAEALREAVEFYDRRLEDARRNAIHAHDFRADRMPSPTEAERRERARAALTAAGVQS